MTSDLILIVVSLPLPLSIPPPPCFLSQASFSQKSSEPTHHTDLGLARKLMFSRCSSLSHSLSVLSSAFDHRKKPLLLPPFEQVYKTFAFQTSLQLHLMFSYMRLSAFRERPHSFHKRPTFCVPFCPLLRSAELKSSFPHLLCCAGFCNSVWEVNGAYWRQIPLINSVPSSSCLIAVNQFISFQFVTLLQIWGCQRAGSQRWPVARKRRLRPQYSTCE